MGGRQADSTNRGEGRVYVTYIYLRKQVTFTFGYWIVLPCEFHSTSVHVTKHSVTIYSPQEIIFHSYYYTASSADQMRATVL